MIFLNFYCTKVSQKFLNLATFRIPLALYTFIALPLASAIFSRVKKLI